MISIVGVHVLVVMVRATKINNVTLTIHNRPTSVTALVFAAFPLVVTRGAVVAHIPLAAGADPPVDGVQERPTVCRLNRKPAFRLRRTFLCKY